MALEKEDLLDLRIQWLKDMLEIEPMRKPGVNSLELAKLKEMLRNAEADRTALKDKAAAEVHRRLQPEF